jgi:hypothetical protein
MSHLCYQDGSTCMALGPMLTVKSHDAQGDAQKLQDALHFKEAGITVEEQWILICSVG